MKLGWLDYFKLLMRGKPVLQEAIKQGADTKAALDKSSWKSTEFWKAALTGLGAVAAQASGLIPPPYGAIVMAASSAVYALSRGLAKHSDPLGGIKPGASTTEFWGNLTSSLGAVLMATSGAVAPETAAVLVAVSNSAYELSRGLAKGGAQPEALEGPKPAQS